MGVLLIIIIFSTKNVILHLYDEKQVKMDQIPQIYDTSVQKVQIAGPVKRGER